jgi:hypothetical protein
MFTDEQERVQKKTFVNWINSYLSKVRIFPNILSYSYLCNSVSITSDYGLDDRAIEIGSSAEATDFSSILCVQIGSGAHPASYPMDTGVPFPQEKVRPGRDTDHSTPSSVEVKNE